MDDDNVYLAPPTSDVVEYARWLDMRFRKAFADLRQEYGPATSNYASNVGHPCLANQYYRRVGAERTPIKPETQAIFESGDMWERETVSFMRAEMDQEWAKAQTGFPKDELNIGCRIDGGFRPIRARDQRLIVGEIKRVNAREFKKIAPGGIQGIHDMLNRCSWWIRKYLFQGASYLHYSGEHGLIFILREPQSGWAKFVPMPADADITKEIWKQCESNARIINAAVESKQVPERMQWDKQVCGMCDYANTVCFPETQNLGMEVLAHPSMLADVAEYLGTLEAVKMHNAARDRIRYAVLHTKKDHVLLGQYAEARVRKSGTGKSVHITKIKEEEDNE